MLSFVQFQVIYPTISFRREGDQVIKQLSPSFENNKGGWRCGSSFIPKKSKYYTDPVSGQKLKQPITYNLYRKKRAAAVQSQAQGKPLTEREKVYAASVESDRAKLQQKKVEKAAKSVGASKVIPGGIASVNPQQIEVDQKLFGTVGKSKAASDLKRGGNQINIDESASIAKNANTTLTLFDKTKNQAGKVNEILNKSAERLANGEKRERVTKEARAEIESYLQERFKYGRKGSGNSTSKTNFRRRKIKLINFNEGYYYQTRNGKRVMVRKNKKIGSVAKHDLITGARYGGSALGFVAGAGAGSLLVKTAGRNGVLRNTAMAAGAATGAAVAAILANHLLDKYERNGN